MNNPLMGNNETSKQQKTLTNEEINKLYETFKKNPLDFLIKSKLNIPQNIGNNPQQILQYLLNSKQIPQQILPRVHQMLGIK